MTNPIKRWIDHHYQKQEERVLESEVLDRAYAYLATNKTPTYRGLVYASNSANPGVHLPTTFNLRLAGDRYLDPDQFPEAKAVAFEEHHFEHFYGDQVRVGIRRWALDREQLGLRALTVESIDDAWPARQAPRACCNRGERGAGWVGPNRFPHPDSELVSRDCSCGYYAYGRSDLLCGHDRIETNRDVVGTVYQWGKIVECEWGWRSEYAYPKELWICGGTPLRELIASNLSGRYGVPVHLL